MDLWHGNVLKLKNHYIYSFILWPRHDRPYKEVSLLKFEKFETLQFLWFLNFQKTETTGSFIFKCSQNWNQRLLKESNNCQTLDITSRSIQDHSMNILNFPLARYVILPKTFSYVYCWGDYSRLNLHFTKPHLCWNKSALTVAHLNQSISLCPEVISLGMYSWLLRS
jgi:hypothetical protein